MNKLYLIVLSSEAGQGNFFMAEKLEFINESHIKVSGYFVSGEDIEEYRQLKKEGAEPRNLIIPCNSYIFIEELSV